MEDFEKIYSEYFDVVYHYVLSLCFNEYLAEEITQEAFFKALKNIDSFRGDCKVNVWLCQIAKNLYISYTRKKKTVHSELLEQMSDSTNLEDSYIQKEEAISIYKILHYLEEPYKEVFVLRVLADLSYKEIAEIFEKQENWARVTYHRAKLKVRELMSKQTDTY